MRIRVGYAASEFSGNNQLSAISVRRRISQSSVPDQQARFVGIVAPDSSLNRLLFEVVRALELKEGALVEVNIGAQRVAYQVIEGMTRETSCFRKNTFGFVRGEAMKIGIWNAAESRFLRAQWLPDPNSAVLLAAPAAVAPASD